MKADSPEFQDACQAAAEKIKTLILEISQSSGNDTRTALAGALAAVGEFALQTRPEGMDDSTAAMQVTKNILFYMAQNANGHAIDYDKVVN